MAEEALPPLTGLSQLAAAAAAKPSTAAAVEAPVEGKPQATAPKTGRSLLRNALLAVGLGVVIVAAAALLVGKGLRRSEE